MNSKNRLIYKSFAVLLFSFFLALDAIAQQIPVSIFAKDSISKQAIPFARLYLNGDRNYTSDINGVFSLGIERGKYKGIISADGYKTQAFSWDIVANEGSRTFLLQESIYQLDGVTVKGVKDPFSVTSQTKTKGTTIYEGKKNELILLSSKPANTAINSTRQIYAKIAGVNIIENDDAGVQLSIGTRGLNPNRTTAFNSRQNGYDISADPIGYPENYYTPPTDGVESIEIIRGAAGLQFGTQFGGLLNFNMKKGSTSKPFELVTKQTAGSYGFFNSFNSIGGQQKNLNYYGFYNYKRSDGWRKNTGFDIHNGYASLQYALSKKLTLGFDYTFMDYQMKQPGGLTDIQFKQDARQSTRSRNWFAANWNIPALSLDYTIDSNNFLSVKTYALIATRKNVGNLNPIIFPDDASQPRIVMNDEYRNYFVESRYIHHYQLVENLKSSLVGGLRFYHGNTHRIQGYNYTGSNADFTTRNGDELQIDYRFPSYNLAAFAENIFQVTDKFSVTPGVRFEFLETNAKGYTRPDTSITQQVFGNESVNRSFPLFGLGLAYQITNKTNAYANFSQNFSPVNFSDIVIIQPATRIDPNLKDVKGYNVDLGYRGRFGNLVNFDVSGFYMLYKNRVGTLLQSDGGGEIYQYKTNISDSRSFGTELYAEINLLHLIPSLKYTEDKVSIYGSVAYTNASYINIPADRKQFEGKQVEYAAPWIDRFGIDYLFGALSGTIQYSYTDAQFSDATNAFSSSDGSVGLIPAYHAFDFTTSYKFKKWKLSMSINNFTDEKYFTRRAIGFPGPGIISSEGRAIYGTLQFTF
ncbi:TonB-dependent receptor domain-containing protein [Pedobacter arcticus]|uniref:TonB-dependent receptor domain-containing protein n=1 Tax=Pedobacter arcticus TaxID=752140 RepID=UPI00031E8EAC|nr:TonB-dependent receptor [Pedobacter arcticus]